MSDTRDGIGNPGSALRRDAAFADGDAIYEALVAMTDGLDDADAMRVMAKLILLLANQVGDEAVLRAAIAVARDGTRG